jgi:hypothetical protein
MTAWISSADVQAWIGADLTTDQATDLADAATSVARDWLERDLALATYTELYDSLGTDYVLLNAWPIRTLTSIALNGEGALAASAYSQPGWRLDPLNPRKVRFPGRKVARGIQNIAVTYTAGYDLTQPAGSPTGLPGAVRKALQLIASALDNAQAADPNLASENTGGVFSGSFYATGVGAIPPGARTLLQSYRRVA